MNPEMQKKLFEYLDAIAAKLNVTSQVLWNVLVRQARVDAIQYGLWAITLIIATFVLKRFVYPILEKQHSARAQVIAAKAKEHGYCFDDNGWTGAMVASWILGVAFVLGAIACVYAMLTPLLNPQYQALQDLFSLLPQAH
jgi:hypothetical protein